MMVQKAYSSGNAEERIKHALLGLKEYPHSRGLLWHAAEVDIMNGQEDQAKFRWEQAYHKLFKSDVEVDNKLIWQAKYIARVLLRTGETKQAKHLIDECWKCYKERFPYGEPLLEAGLHLLDGNEESALESLGRYVETGGSSFALRHQTEFDVIRQRKEFQALLAQADARMALQLNLLREMEANGELAPIPELPEKLEPDEAPAQLQMQEMQYEGSQ
jgi:hypothetical protein